MAIRIISQSGWSVSHWPGIGTHDRYFASGTPESNEAVRKDTFPFTATSVCPGSRLDQRLAKGQ